MCEIVHWENGPRCSQVESRERLSLIQSVVIAWEGGLLLVDDLKREAGLLVVGLPVLIVWVQTLALRNSDSYTV